MTTPEKPFRAACTHGVSSFSSAGCNVKCARCGHICRLHEDDGPCVRKPKDVEDACTCQLFVDELILLTDKL